MVASEWRGQRGGDAAAYQDLEGRGIFMTPFLSCPGRGFWVNLKSRDVAQPGRAQRSGRWGRRFKSSRPDQLFLPSILPSRVEERQDYPLALSLTQNTPLHAVEFFLGDLAFGVELFQGAQGEGGLTPTGAG